MIYILDEEIKKCAQYLDDRALKRMIKDIAQTLCNAHYYGEDKDKPPLEFSNKKSIAEWVTWIEDSRANYLRLVELGLACCDESYHRHGITDFNVEYRNIMLWARDCAHNKNYQKDADIWPVLVPHNYFVCTNTGTDLIVEIYESYRAHYKGR